MPTLFVVSHTHWDREWHEPFQVFRGRLVRCVDQLLDLFASDPDYREFLLDGQTIVLDDYLEVRPEREPILRDLVRAGKLHIGPWYVLPDEFLVSGEAIVRNLLRGIRHARAFGKVMRIGYIPDPFGHISQMPQILRGFGIGAAAFRRGLADEPTELWWEASDGTRVLACYLRDGYDNAAFLPRDPARFVEGIKKLRASLAPHALTGNFLLMNGTDHMEPWPDLTRLLQSARREITDAAIVHASLPAYVARVQQEIATRALTLPVVRGELRNPKRHHLLPGVASSRTWLKQRNAHAQMLLEKWAEPFVAFAGFQNASAPAAPSLVRLAWKYLLQNHPHDSICGCSIDQVHEEMRPRFDAVEQIAEQVIAEGLDALAATIDTRVPKGMMPLVVFNPTDASRTDVVTTTLELPGRLEHFALQDDTGAVLPFQIHNRRVEEYHRAEMTGESLGLVLNMGQDGRVMGLTVQDAFARTDTNPMFLDVTLGEGGAPNLALLQEGLPRLQQIVAQNPAATFDVRVHSPARVQLEFVARAVPGWGYRVFWVSSSTPQVSDSAPHAPHLSLENEFFRVEPDAGDGTLTITDKTTGAIFRGINRFVDSGDRGDLYNYCPPEHDTLIAQPSAPPHLASERGAARQSLRVAMTYRLPARLTDDRTARTQEWVDERIVTTVSLYPGVRRIDFRVEVENRARDHRLCVEFPAPIVTAYANVGQAFDVVTRALDLPRDTTDWVEQPRPEAPMQDFVSISDRRIGLTLATRGLVEYAARREENGTTLALTLLRCTGWLSRSDLTTRSGDAGPQKETPGAQAIGAHVFEYALIPGTSDWRGAFAEVRAFTAPLRAITTDAHAGTLPPAASFAHTFPSEFVVSAIKWAEEGRGLVVRGYNSGDAPIDARIVLWKAFARAVRVNLNEEEIAPLDLREGREVVLRVRAREIVTVRFIQEQEIAERASD